MKKKDNLVITLSTIAIVLSIVAIIVVITSSGNIQDNNFDARIKQVFDLAVNNELEARLNLAEATDELREFNTCMNDATENLILCNIDYSEKLYCSNLYFEASSNCETRLRDSYWFD